MISAKQLGEFGWGMTLTEDQLEQINVKRARDVGYCDKVASKGVLGTTKKRILPSHHSFASLSTEASRRDIGQAITSLCSLRTALIA